LDSIAAQTVPVLEVIVIDDCSTDESAEVITRWLDDHDLGYSFISHHKNVGVCATLNEAVAIAKGTYFCHVSGDDWEEPDRFRHQVDYFGTLDESVALLVGDIREVDAGGSTITEHDFSTRASVVTQSASRDEALTALLAENVIPAPGTMLRTAAVRAVGGFDESLAFEDYDMWMRLASEYSMAYKAGIVCNYRVVSSGLTRNTNRRVSVLTSEADMVAKHIGSSKNNDAIITSRLLPIAGQLMLLGSVSGVRHVLGKALSASDNPRIRSAYIASRTKRGLKALVKKRGHEFKVSAQRR
jgi:glycosyltransferase involved in cell wall biosynthesis